MRRGVLAVGGLMVAVGAILLTTVITAREIRDPKESRALYGSIMLVVGFVIALVARIFISQRG